MRSMVKQDDQNAPIPKQREPSAYERDSEAFQTLSLYLSLSDSSPSVTSITALLGKDNRNTTRHRNGLEREGKVGREKELDAERDTHRGTVIWNLICDA